jgi:hypothetical protein
VSAALGEPFRIGRVVARAIWGRELLLLLSLALVVHAPRIASVECIHWATPEPPQVETRADRLPDGAELGELVDSFARWFRRAVPWMVASYVLQVLFTNLSLALVIFAVCARVRGVPATFRGSIRGGLRSFFPVLRVSLWLSLVTAALHLAAVLLVVKLVFTPSLGLGRTPLWTAAWLRLLVPVLITLLTSPFWVAVPAAVLEEPRRLLRRSFRLTRGRRLSVCAILILIYAIDWGSGRLLRLLLPNDLPWLAQRAVWWTRDLLVVSLAAVFAAVGYHALRLEKEGVDVSDLERVFA